MLFGFLLAVAVALPAGLVRAFRDGGARRLWSTAVAAALALSVAGAWYACAENALELRSDPLDPAGIVAAAAIATLPTALLVHRASLERRRPAVVLALGAGNFLLLLSFASFLAFTISPARGLTSR